MMGRDLMLAHPPVDVDAAAFIEAASRVTKMKRAPLGAKGSIPKDTILAPHGDGIMVETPLMGTVVATTQSWRVLVSVDARRLLELCEKFKKLGALKEANSTFAIRVDQGELRVKYKTTTIGIPIL